MAIALAHGRGARHAVRRSEHHRSYMLCVVLFLGGRCTPIGDRQTCSYQIFQSFAGEWSATGRPRNKNPFPVEQVSWMVAEGLDRTPDV